VKDDHTVVFIHVNKTAGLTLRSIFDNQYGQSSILILNPFKVRDDILTFDEFKEAPARMKAGKKLITGHMRFRLGVHNYHPRPCVYVTMLRDVVKRIVSYYYYLLESDKPYNQKAVADCKDLDDFVIKGCSWNNIYTYCFSAIDVIRNKPVSKDAVKSAKFNLKHVFAATGITEQFDESLKLFKSVLGWNRIPEYTNKNITKKRPPLSEIPRKTIDLIEEYNQADLELYNYAKYLFNKRSELSDEELQLQSKNRLIRGYQLYIDNSVHEEYEQIIKQGESLFNKQLFNKARDIFQLAVRLNPFAPTAFNNLGVLHYSLGDIKNAKKNFRQALIINPLYQDALANYFGTLKEAENG